MSKLKEKLLPIIREAGKIIASAHDVERDTDIDVKAGSANFVTVYDVKVQEFLMTEIKKAFPSAEFFAEEKNNDRESLMSEYCFIIDPIDGTTNFIHDYKLSCISVAALRNGETVFGAVYDPYLGEMFCAEKGEGAYLNGTRISVSDRPVDIAVAAYGTAPYYKDTLGDKTFSLCREVFSTCADIRRCGSAAMDLAYLAAGRCDLFFEFLLSPWDIAAGALIIAEAGGIITDMKGNGIELSSPTPVIAANKRIYPTLLELAKKY